MSGKPACYVLMPFAKTFDVTYEVICGAAAEEGYDCSRADQRNDYGLISQSIILDILLSDAIIADISGLNANVLYELGIAHALKKPTILLSRELTRHRQPPFDISHMLTIPYSAPRNKADASALKLKEQIRKRLRSGKTRDNPFSIAITAEGVRLANYFGSGFLWGYARTLSESMRASTAWVVSRRLYWERMDNLFHRRIFEERILTGERRELVLLPDNEAIRGRCEAALGRYRALNPNVGDLLRILYSDDERLWAFLPTEVSIYDADTPDLRAILLEPMAQEGVDDENDHAIADALRAGDDHEARRLSLREATFDVALSRATAESLAAAFRRFWNDTCRKQGHRAWLI